MRRIGYQNAVLSLIAIFLGVGLLERAAAPGLTQPAVADAAQPEPDQGGLTNALEQRKQIINELRMVGTRLDRIEARLAGTMNVKVIDMPPVKMASDGREKGEKTKPDARVEVSPAADGK
jgi:hypothetical protein